MSWLGPGDWLAGISHPDAGDGLFLQGSAPVGAVVALYPGLVYEPMHYRLGPADALQANYGKQAEA